MSVGVEMFCVDSWGGSRKGTTSGEWEEDVVVVGPGLVKPSNSIFGDFELTHFLVNFGVLFTLVLMKNYHRLSF